MSKTTTNSTDESASAKATAGEHQMRLKRLEQIEKMGINPYPSQSHKTHEISELGLVFDDLSAKQTKITLAGRIRALRGHGGSTFGNIEDGSGKFQVYFKKDELGDTKNAKYAKLRKCEIGKAHNDYGLVGLLDVGDFVECSGGLFKTKRGEKTLLVKDFKILAKALLPLPDKWSGFKDEEERLRKRYLDILFNPEVKEMFERKSKFWNVVREFLIKKNFMEVETPVLEVSAGGADARPFATHHNALDMDVYLRISMGELWQKKLMVAGFEKTFEIGRQFRNEGMDVEHLQDYTQMEFYWAYADYEKGMKLTEELYKYVAKEVWGTLKFEIARFDSVKSRQGNYKVDLGKKWEIYDYQETVKKITGIDVLKTNLKEVELKLKELKIKYDRNGFNLNRAIDSLWKYCRKQITGPGFLVHVPVMISPLAKRCDDKPELTQRFQVIIAGSELGNGYSELNNPIDQAERFNEQQKLRDQGDDEAQMYDVDFVEALEYGMPPTCGFGMSERVFSFFENKSIRECQIFPLMRPRDTKHEACNTKQK